MTALPDPERPARIRVTAPGLAPCWMMTAQPSTAQTVRLTKDIEAAHVAPHDRLAALAQLLNGYVALCGSNLHFDVEDAA